MNTFVLNGTTKAMRNVDLVIYGPRKNRKTEGYGQIKLKEWLNLLIKNISSQLVNHPKI